MLLLLAAYLKMRLRHVRVHKKQLGDKNGVLIIDACQQHPATLIMGINNTLQRQNIHYKN